MEPRPALSRRAWFTLAFVCALAFVHFWVRSTPVRLATTDDVVFQALADEGTTETFTTENARSQARFYYGTPLFGPALSGLYEIRTPWLFSLLRTAALFAQIGLAGWLLARVTRVPALGAALGLLILATLHVPRTFYPVLSYPFDWLGFIAVLGALHLHLSFVRRRGALTGCLAAVLFLLACLMHEIFVLFLPLFAVLSWLQPAGGWFARLRTALGPGAVAAGYVTVYLLFSRQFPTTYDGTQFSLNLVSAGQVLVRQMIGILPGFELVVQRLVPGTPAPLFRTGPEVAESLRALPRWDLLVALTKAAALTGLLLRCSRHIPPVLRLWPWALVFAVWLNLPIAFSAKYQVFIMQREFPYAYAFYAFFFLCLALLGAVTQGLQLLLTGHRGPRLVAALLGLVTTVLCVSAAASNHRVMQFLAQKYN